MVDKRRMTPEAALDELEALASHAQTDPEKAHVRADDALCGVLRFLGWDEIADAYERIEPKWYA